MSRQSDKESPQKSQLITTTEKMQSYNSRLSRRNNSLVKDCFSQAYGYPQQKQLNQQYFGKPKYINQFRVVRSRSETFIVQMMTQAEVEPPTNENNFSIGYYLNSLLQLSDDQFLSDGIYLEVLYFQLTSLGLSRTPICSSPPIIALILQVLHLIGNTNDVLSILNSLFDNDQEVRLLLTLIKQHKSLVESLCQSLQLSCNSEYAKNLPIEKGFLQMLSENLQFQKESLIEDLIIYQNLYKTQTQIIQNSYNDSLLRSNNICIGFIKFTFSQEEGEEFNFRTEIGNFTKHQFVDYMKVDPMFLKYIQSDQSHSERILCAFLLCDFECSKSILNNLRGYLQGINKTLKLTMISVQITSEKRVCKECINLFLKFPIHKLLDQIFEYFKDGKILIKIDNGFKFVFFSQYFVNHGHKKWTTPHKGTFITYNNQNFRQTIRIPVLYVETGTTGIISCNKFFKQRYSACISSEVIKKPLQQIIIPCTIFVSSGDKVSKDSSNKQILVLQNNQEIPDQNLVAQSLKQVEFSPDQQVIQQNETQHKDCQKQETLQKEQTNQTSQYVQNEILLMNKEQQQETKFPHSFQSLEFHTSNRITQKLDEYVEHLLSKFSTIQQQGFENKNQIEFANQNQEHFSLDQVVINLAFRHLILLLQIGKININYTYHSDINFKWIAYSLRSLIFKGIEEKQNLLKLDYFITQKSKLIPHSFTDFNVYQEQLIALQNPSIFHHTILNQKHLFYDYKIMQTLLTEFKGLPEMDLTHIQNYTLVTLIQDETSLLQEIKPTENQNNLNCPKLINLLQNYTSSNMKFTVVIFTIQPLKSCCISYLVKTFEGNYQKTQTQISFEFRYLKFDQQDQQKNKSSWFSYLEPKVLRNRYGDFDGKKNWQSMNDFPQNPDQSFIYECQADDHCEKTQFYQVTQDSLD